MSHMADGIIVATQGERAVTWQDRRKEKFKAQVGAPESYINPSVGNVPNDLITSPGTTA